MRHIYEKRVSDIERYHLSKLINNNKRQLIKDGNNIFIFNENCSLLLDKEQDRVIIKDFIFATPIFI